MCQQTSVIFFWNNSEKMKIQAIYIAIFCIIGFAAANNLVPWTSISELKVTYNVPYKIDAEANFSNRTMKTISSSLKRAAQKLSVKYKEHENETIHLLITSLKRCTEDRVNNISRPSTTILACMDDPYANIKAATRMAREMNRMKFHPEMKSDDEEENQENAAENL